MAGTEISFGGPMFFKEVTMGAGVACHSLGKVFQGTGDFFALSLAVFAETGVSQRSENLVEIVQEFAGAAMGHAVFDAVFPDAEGRFQEGAAAVSELDPINREMNIGTVSSGVIPDTEEVNGKFKAEEIERFFKYGVVLIWGAGGFLKKHGEGLIEDFRSEVGFCAVDGAFTGSKDLVEVFAKAEPLFEGSVGEGDFEISDRRAAFVSAQDADSEGVPGVLNEIGETSVEGFAVFGPLAAFFEGLIEDELIQAAELKTQRRWLRVRGEKRGSSRRTALVRSELNEVAESGRLALVKRVWILLSQTKYRPLF